MQKNSIIFLLLIASILKSATTLHAQCGTCQPGFSCLTTVQMTYDAAGNRTKRLKLSYCGQSPLRTAPSNTDKTKVVADVPIVPMAIATIYPNPTRAAVNVTFTSKVENARLIVLDATGKQLATHTVSGTAYELDLSALASGMYYVALHTDEANSVQKVVKLEN